MIKEIKTEKFEWLAVLVPDGFKGGVANMGYLTGKMDNPATRIHEKHFNSPYAIQKQLDRVNKLPEYVDAPAINLPVGDYKIIGKASELTEEQCTEIMPKPVAVIGHLSVQTGTNYLSGSAKVDFDNYLQFVLKCFTVNPYAGIFTPRLPASDKLGLGEIIGYVIYNDMKELYEEAEANKGTWLILRKIS